MIQQQTIKTIKSTTNYHKSNKPITQQNIAKKMVFTCAKKFNIFNNVNNKTLKVTFLGLLVIGLGSITCNWFLPHWNLMPTTLRSNLNASIVEEEYRVYMITCFEIF
jgi:transcription elongation factor GreA-like protein